MNISPKFFSAAAMAALLLAPAARAGTIEQRALAPLQRMSDTLAAAKSFTYQSRTVVEVPAKTGQLITMVSQADVALRRPDKLMARFTGEAPHFDFFYNGATASAYAPGNNVYSTTKAPATIDAMLPALQKETGIRIASAGLLRSNPFAALTQGMTSAALMGTVQINGEPCDHLAFRRDGVNWEIWIPTGARALPRRLAATFTDRPGNPRVLVEFSNWNLHPLLHPGDFEFHPPRGSREIPFLSVVRPSAATRLKP